MVKHYISLALSIILNASALLLLKKTAMGELQTAIESRHIGTIARVAMNPAFLLAVLLFGVGVFFWMFALARIDLSLAYPTVSSSYVVIALASLYLFDEKITATRWLGMGIVILGIIVMYRR